MAINKISDSSRNAIIKKSVNMLPNNPSEKGFKAEAIKKAMYDIVTGKKESIIAELDRIIDEINKAFTDDDIYRKKVDSIEESAQKNVQADWIEKNPGSDSYIKNKPIIPSGVIVEDNLESEETEHSLSAKQGMHLNKTKLDISQGVDNANKTMVTDAEGNITPSDVVYVSGITIQKGITEDGETCIEFIFPDEETTETEEGGDE